MASPLIHGPVNGEFPKTSSAGRNPSSARFILCISARSGDHGERLRETNRALRLAFEETARWPLMDYRRSRRPFSRRSAQLLRDQSSPISDGKRGCAETGPRRCPCARASRQDDVLDRRSERCRRCCPRKVRLPTDWRSKRRARRYALASRGRGWRLAAAVFRPLRPNFHHAMPSLPMIRGSYRTVKAATRAAIVVNGP